jgi:hypothetical protein
MSFQGWGLLLGIAIFLLIPFGCPSQALGQTNGAVHGQVLDPSGSAVVNASVVVATPAGNTIVATSNQQGAFDLKGLVPGKYTLQVIAQGFAVYKNENVEVTAGQIQQLKINLAIEEQQQKVVVSENAPVVDVSPEKNAGAIIISGKELEALPDDPDELQSDLSALAGPSAGPNGGQFYIDGFTAGQLPPKSAIREIRINQNPFSAQYDKVGYGRVEIFTKPGSDKWHGQVSINGNDSAFNSQNPYFEEKTATSEYPGYYSTQYSANVGGPLGKKASIFLNADIRDIQDLSVVNAQTLNSENQIVPFSEAVQNPRTRYNLGSRFDYQLTNTNTLSVRYQYYRDDQKNDGVGGFTLASQGYNILTTENTLQVSDTQSIGTNVINETRFQYLRDATNQVALNTAPTLVVQGAFNGGGSNAGNLVDLTNHYELQNYTSVQHGKHFITFGGRLRGLTDQNNSTAGFNGEFVFPSIEAYQSAVVNGSQTASQYLLTAGPTAMTPGNPLAYVSQVDIGVYVQDDWRVRQNITLSYGLRFESQNEVNDHANWAPRLGFAWGLGPAKAQPKTVLRAGFGIFYDRFLSSYVLQQDRMNGVDQAQYVFTNPTFFPNSMPIGTVPPSIYQPSGRLRPPYVMQTAVSLERQLTKVANMSVSYLNSRGWDQLLTNNVNIPIAGTYDYPYYSSATPGTRPNTTLENIYQFQSEGIYRENQLFVQTTVRAGSKLMLFAYYTLTYAKGDTFGATSFPSNPNNLLQDYGRSPFDIRNRFFLGGTIALPHNFRLSPFMIASSGAPYNITLSQDLIGTSQYNQRPAFANGQTGSDIVAVPGIGSFNTVPVPGEALVPVNYLTAPNRFTLNLRLSKTFGFGGEKSGQQNSPSGGGGGRRGGGGGGSPYGGGFGGYFGALSGTTNRRYNLTFSVNARNVLNRVNVMTPSAVLSPPTAEIPQASASPFFAIPNALAGQPYSTSSANRQIFLQASFSF